MQPNLKSDAAVVAVESEAHKITAFAQSLVIQTNEGYSQAADTLKAIKGLLRQIEDARVRVTRPLNEALRAVNAQAKEASAPLLTSESRIKRAMVTYSTEQERIRREEQRKAEEAARKEREKLEAQARKAEAAGRVERAMELEQRAATVVAPVIQREPPKVSGVAMRSIWRFEVVDPAAVPREYLVVDEKRIGAVVRAMKGDTQIPGVRVWEEKSLAAGVA